MIFWLRVLVTLAAALSAVPLGVGVALLLAAAAAFRGGGGGPLLAGAVLTFIAAAFAGGLLYLDRWLSLLPVPGRRGFEVGVVAPPERDVPADRDRVVMPDARWRRRLPLALVCAVAIIVGTVTTPVAWWFHGFSRNLRLAEGHAPVVRQVLEADGRFTELEVSEYTGHNGCLLVSAVVPEGAAQDVKRLVESTSPPVAVRYEVYELQGSTVPRPVRVDLDP
jgi:hypothetical protein